MKIAFTAALVLGAASAAFGEPLDKIAKKISHGHKGLENKKVAVLPFPRHDGRPSGGSTIVSERLITKIAALKKLEVIERSLLENVLKELKLQASGAIDEQSAQQIGKILGVEAVVSGTLIDLDENQVEVNARLIRAQSGQILAAQSETIARQWREEAAAPQPSSPQSARAAEPQPARAAQSPEPAGAPRTPQPVLVFSNRPMEHEPGPPLPPPHETADPSEVLLFAPGLEPHESEGPFAERVHEGVRLLRGGDPGAAEDVFRSLERDSRGARKQEAISRLGLSAAMFAQGRERDAYRLAEDISARNDVPAVSSMAHFLLGRYQEAAGDEHGARGHYLTVVRSSPFPTPLVRRAGERFDLLSRRDHRPPPRRMGRDFRRDRPPHPR